MGKPTKTVKISFRADRFYSAGTEIAADDPVVARYPSMFVDTVRVTATVPPVTAPPPANDPTPARPSTGASKAKWAAYVAELGGTPDDNATKADLQALADELEG